MRPSSTGLTSEAHAVRALRRREPTNDNSLDDPRPFVDTNIIGTYALLEGGAPARHPVSPHLHRRGLRRPRARRPGALHRGDPLQPLEPLLSTKAGSDLLVHSVRRSFVCRATISQRAPTTTGVPARRKFIPRQITTVLRGLAPQAVRAGLQRARIGFHGRRPLRRVHFTILEKRPHPARPTSFGATDEKNNKELWR